jgi:cytochrome c556
MSSKTFAAAVLLAGLAGGLARAQAPPPPADFAAMRQASVDMSVILRDEMKRAMQEGREAKTQAYATYALARWARVLPTLFPAGSGPGQSSTYTQALPSVWADRAGFDRAAANFAAAADRLGALANANDTEGFKAGLVALQGACDACHAVYKSGMQRPPN